MKTCTICETTRDKAEFNKKTKSPDGLDPWCKSCKSKKDKENYKRRAEKVKNKVKEYYYKNRDSILKRIAESETKKEYQKKYRELNKEELNLYARNYKLTNKERIKEQRKEYRLLNRDKIRSYEKHKLETDSLFKLAKRCRNRLQEALKAKNWTKQCKFKDYIGCDLATLKSHLEAQFKDGMTWENYGDWHIDHKYPLSLATSPEEIYALCHYTNLQPLWALDNLAKSNKIE